VAVDGTAVRAWMGEFATVVHDAKDELTTLDAAIGDADHGANLDRGMTAAMQAVEALDAASAPGAVLKAVAMSLISKVGGASGPLYGTLLLRMSASLGAAEDVDTAGFAAALRAGVEGVTARGKAVLEDKTMLDALLPACDALDAAVAADHDLGTALRAASSAADAGRDATIPLVARKGRASYLGERSAGHQDPGATSSALLLATAAATLA